MMEDYKAKWSLDSEVPAVNMAVVRSNILSLLKEPGIYAEVERNLSEPGVTGRVSWDRCLAVLVILDADAVSEVTKAVLNKQVKNEDLTLPALGDQLMKVLKTNGLVITRGRIVGMLEYLDDDSDA